MKIDIEPEIANHVLPLVRGLKLSRDLDLAEQAIRAEREILKAQDAFAVADFRNHLGPVEIETEGAAE